MGGQAGKLDLEDYDCMIKNACYIVRNAPLLQEQDQNTNMCGRE